LNNSNVLRILTTLYLAKKNHRWVTFIALKTITENAAHLDEKRPAAELRETGPGSQRSAGRLFF